MNSGRYFPARAFHDDLAAHEFVERWYAAQLRALREEALLGLVDDGHREVYRFLWLRTFHRPMSFRLDVNPDGSALLTIRETSGKGGYAPGDLVVDRSVAISAPAVAAFRALLQDCGFWQMPTRGKSLGLDGAQWIIEAVNGGKYHLVDRFGGDELRKSALLLVSYSGVDVEPVY